MASVNLLVCLCVRALKGKRLELSTPNLVQIYSMAVARHTVTWRLKGQRLRSHSYEDRHGLMVAGGCCGRCAAAAGVDRISAGVKEGPADCFRICEVASGLSGLADCSYRFLFC